MKRVLLAGLFAVMLTLSACGGSDDTSDSGGSGSGSGSSALSGDDAEAAGSISDEIMKSQESSGAADFVVVKKADADCIGEGLVDKVGVDDLVTYGLLTKDLKTSKDLSSVTMSKDDAEGAADVITGCTDLKAMMQKAMASALDNLPAKVKDCFNEALTEDAIHGMFVQIFSGKSSDAGEALTKPMAECAKQLQ